MSQRIADRYTLIEVLGGGGTSVVHRAQVAGGLPDVALKLLRPQFAADPVLRRRFLREAELARKLSHPGIVRVLDAGDGGGQPFLTLELMTGETLRRRLEREQRLAAGDALAIFVLLARALGHAHSQGVIHRDVKPENVFLSGADVKLGDFGNARVVSLASVTGASLSWGTPEYVAAEVFMRGRADPRSDLYSLGVLLYEMLTGRLPWSRSETLARLANGAGARVEPAPTGAGDAIDAQLRALLAASPAERPASAQEVLARLSDAPGVADIDKPTTCTSCGGSRPSDVPLCLSCGGAVLNLSHTEGGGWRLVLDTLEDDPAAVNRLLTAVDSVARPPERALQFLTGPRDLYSNEEKEHGVSLPAVLFSDLDEETARSLEAQFRVSGVQVRAVQKESFMRSMHAVLARTSSRRAWFTLVPMGALAVAGLVSGGRLSFLFSAAFGLSLVLLVGGGLARWRKEVRLPSFNAGVFELRAQPATGPSAQRLLAGAAGVVGAVRAPEVRALLGDVGVELFRLTRRAEQLSAAGEPTSEGELLRRMVAEAPALVDRLRRMAERLDDLDAALEGQTEGELMQSLARLERAAGAAGADRAALGAARRDVEATLERRHAVEQERARLSAKLCELLGHLRVVYREATAMETVVDREARALAAASAELDALLAAPGPR